MFSLNRSFWYQKIRIQTFQSLHWHWRRFVDKYFVVAVIINLNVLLFDNTMISYKSFLLLLYLVSFVISTLLCINSYVSSKIYKKKDISVTNILNIKWICGITVRLNLKTDVVALASANRYEIQINGLKMIDKLGQ